MYIPKRWLVPGALSVVLTAFIMASFLANVMGGNADPSPTEAIDVAARLPVSEAAPTVLVNGAQCDPVGVTATDTGAITEAQRADIIAYLNAVEANKSAGNDFATNSGVVANSQFNDGGFGDIGEQWREVEVGGPVTNIHISGTGNNTTVVIGNDNTVTVDPPAPVDEVTPDPTLASIPVAEVPAPAAPVVEAPAVEAPAEAAAA